MDFVAGVGRFTYFALRSLIALPSVLRQPQDFLVQFYGVLVGALPLAVTAGAAIGVVVWIHLRESLQSVGGPGAVRYLPQAMALAVVLEFAPIGAGLLVAGRSGASLGAELGSMRETEQIDALEALGFAPLRVLVAPRLLACMFALPLLTILIAYLALATGFLAETIGGSLSLTQYTTEVRRVLTPHDVVPATLKTIVFGYLIGAMGCFHGLYASGGTEGVGRAATRGVVGAILLVLVSDVLLVKAIQVFN